MKKKKLILYLVLLVLNLALIWGNSLLDGESSSAFSGWVGGLITKLLPGSQVGSGGSGHGLLRKLGHITEFFLLGMVLCRFLGIWLQNRRWWPVLALAGGVLAACVDETIQRFVPGRSGRLTDVGIDAIGLVLGVVLIYCIEKRKMKISGGKSK